MDWSIINFWNAILAIALSTFATVLAKWYRSRKFIARLSDAGFPVAPDWNWTFGNLLLMDAIGRKIPSKASKVTLFVEVVRQFSSSGCCYIDLWPVSRPWLLIMSPQVGAQACQAENAVSYNKPPELADFFRPIAGGPNLFDLPGKDWRAWRSIFNKGFSDATVLSLVPGMVEAAIQLTKSLSGFAQQAVLFQMDPITLRYAIDFIGKAALNTQFNAQSGFNALADSMLTQIRWQSKTKGANPFQSLNVARLLAQWYNGLKLDKLIGDIVDERYQEHLERRNSAANTSKSVIDLILQSYVLETGSKSSSLDPEFRAFAIRQIRLFLFVGHDSMSSTLCYAIHLLSTNPRSLVAIRDEHDRCFGPDLETLAHQITSNPSILNSLPYTTAVLKEVLRLYPPGGATRQGQAGVELVSDDGIKLPTNGCLLYVLHSAMHRAPEYWEKPEMFMPERFLDGFRDLQPRKNAWRPFEWGPRNCIGQNLAMTELKVSLVFLIRTFDFTSAYDEWDRLYPPKGLNSYRGDRAYQIEEAAAHPADRYPCRASLTPIGRKFLGI